MVIYKYFFIFVDVELIARDLGENFIVNKPFVFVILLKSTNEPIFIGQKSL